jgi:hypothetical protein
MTAAAPSDRTTRRVFIADPEHCAAMEDRESVVPEQTARNPVCSCMAKFLLWCILLVLCWPLALLALLVYPFVWLVLLPFRIVGIAVDGVLGVLRALVTLPARVLAPRT